MKKSKVCVIIPAYNEATVIRDVIDQAVKAFSKQNRFKIDIVLVNDSSTDRTADEAKKAGSIVIDHIINSGAGGATATGLAYAKKYQYDLAATMDADGQHDPKDLIIGLNLITDKKLDLLIGSRLIDSEGMSKIKIIGNKGLSLFTKLIFGTNSSDSQSGLRIFSKRAINDLSWKTEGYEFCSEMLWRAKQLNLQIGEYPIKAIYTDYSKSKGQNNWNAVNIIKSLLKRRILELFG